MCARYVVYDERELMEIRNIIADVEQQMFTDQVLSKGEVYPSHIAPIITAEGARPMKWGFPIDGKTPVINARSETAAEKPMFRSAFAGRRCLIPASGFFEWGDAEIGEQTSLFPDTVPLKKNPKKQKYLFTLPDGGVLYMAGLYGEYLLNGSRYPHFVVLTAAANGSVIGVHDRMPVVLRRGECVKWLKSGGIEAPPPELKKEKAG